MSKIDLSGVHHHQAVEEIVEVLCNKTQNTDKGFFRTEVAYFLAKMASSMRATIVTKDRGEIPVNLYALALATSGFGKGHSVNIVENEFMRGFKKRFMEETMPLQADKHLWEIATDRSLRNSTDVQVEFDAAVSEYRSAGAYPFTFDSGTAPAVKQLRHKLLMANCGAINLQIDEIGSNLLGNEEVLTVGLELFDQGMVKNKLTKNTADSKRGEEIDGKTPTNILMFGTPTKLLDGGQTEEQFFTFLETGYARRCLFGVGKQDRLAFNTQTAEEIFQRLINPANNATVSKWANHFHALADPAAYGWKMIVEDKTAIRLLEYKIECEQKADLLADHEDIKKAELSHRFFKALKLAGAYAFADASSEVELQHLMQAILLVEESGDAFQTILNREKTYVRLAKYIASVKSPLTHADLLEALPFYQRGAAARNEMMTLAIAYGHSRHIVIRKTFVNGIEFFRGETLAETNLDEVILSYSDNFAYHFQGERVPFDQLHVLTQSAGMHWANHHFLKQHRAEENAIVGFNLVTIDVDGGISLAAVHELMKEVKFMTYTTKRHRQVVGQDEDGDDIIGDDRFRLIIPINYELKLDSDDYKEFMANIVSWLPFKTDEQANQRSRKWSCHEGGTYHYNLEGKILDVLPFIPKTTKNDQYQAEYQKVQSLDNLERWFAQRMASGNRNNQMLKFALALVDSGHALAMVRDQVHAFNKKLSNSLDEDEINRTIMVTVANRYQP